MINLTFNPTLEYYAFRNVIWGTPPERVLEEADPDRRSVYLYCDSAASLLDEVPDLNNFPRQVTEDCIVMPLS